jgi:hypothetical protein
LGFRQQRLGALVVADKRAGQRKLVVHHRADAGKLGEVFEGGQRVLRLAVAQQRPGPHQPVHKAIAVVGLAARSDRLDKAGPVAIPDHLRLHKQSRELGRLAIAAHPVGQFHRPVDLAGRDHRQKRVVLQIAVARIMRHSLKIIARGGLEIIFDRRQPRRQIGACQTHGQRCGCAAPGGICLGRFSRGQGIDGRLRQGFDRRLGLDRARFGPPLRDGGNRRQGRGAQRGDQGKVQAGLGHGVDPVHHEGVWRTLNAASGRGNRCAPAHDHIFG